MEEPPKGYAARHRAGLKPTFWKWRSSPDGSDFPVRITPRTSDWPGVI